MAVRSLDRSHLLRRRIERTFALILSGYVLLVGRLIYLQGVHGESLRKEAIHRREQRTVLRANRGILYDRDNRPLAVSLYSGTVGFDPSVVQPDPKDPKKTARMEAALTRSIARAALILDIPEPTLSARIAQARAAFRPEKPTFFFLLKRDVSLEVAQQLRDTRPHLVGFGVQDGDKRYYSSAEKAAQVVGFLKADGSGAAGLERTCGPWLAGRAGYAIAEVDDRRREIPDTAIQTVSAQDGWNVRTTLDANAQHILTEEAQKVFDRYHPDGISAVVVDPNTGDVLALVSLPNYDPNPGQRHTLSPAAQWERCAARLYEPGSTLKSLTIAAALDAGKIRLDSGFYCRGEIEVGKRKIHCASHGGSSAHGYETSQDILRHSCNVGAAQIGLRMGADCLYGADRKFGLFDPLDVHLPLQKRGRLSADPNERLDSPGKVARVAFGHSIMTTPLHVAMAYAALANEGVLMKPRLLTSVTDSAGRVVQKWEPQVVRRVVSPQTSEAVCTMLRSVVTNGTAKVAAIPGYQVAGKTGTANKYRHGAYVGSFVGFLPASPHGKPRAVILVAVDEPKGAYYGAEVAAPAFREIARRLMACWRVPEDDPECTQEKAAKENARRSGKD